MLKKSSYVFTIAKIYFENSSETTKLIEDYEI